MRSERLPGKVMRKIGGRPAIAHIFERLRRAETLDEIWLAGVAGAEDDPVERVALDCGIKVFRGSEHDVVGRFVAVAKASDADMLVRVTADCPMIDPALVDRVVRRFAQGDEDFVSNTIERTYPDGLDVEAFSRDALDRTDREAHDSFLRAHVTPYMHGRLRDRLPWGNFRIAQVVHEADFSHLRWTLDEPDDLEFLNRVVPRLPAGYGWQEALALLSREPWLLSVNSGHRLHEGSARDLASRGPNVPRVYTQSDAYFDRAVRTIPLASQTFSKSHQQWVRGAAPLFLTKGRGCRVEDLDGNGYIDYVLGLLPVILGYRDPDVDAAIIRQLGDGITFSLASPIEAELAERLTRLVPCAERVRFGKNGSDATTAAVRLARAHTGRDKVAICGYHGWHDWYIGTTARDLGVPEAVRALSAKFPFNDADALEALLRADPDGFAAIILEPDGVVPPAPGFLQRVRAVADRYGAVLIFDEIITGFRMDLGGAQKRHGVTPDLASMGKAMANGMPISAVVGRADIMARMDDIFFSATFGGEALSIAAAIATIDKLERENVIDRLWRRGDSLRDKANAALGAAGFDGVVAFKGEGWWPRLAVSRPPVEANLFTSLWRQEFNANGLLLGASLNLCLAHDEDRVENETVTAIARAAAAVRVAVDGPDPAAQLRGTPIRPTFAVR